MNTPAVLEICTSQGSQGAELGLNPKSTLGSQRRMQMTAKRNCGYQAESRVLQKGRQQ